MTAPVHLKVTERSDFPFCKSAEVNAGIVNLWWLGQAGFFLETRNLRILIDPYLSDSLAAKYLGKKNPHKRMMEIPVKPEQLHDIDLVLSTHGHSDHLDPGTVGILAQGNPHCVFVVPESARDLAIERGIPEDRLTGANAGTILKPLDGCAIDCIPSAHETIQLDDRGNHLFLGFILRLEGFAVYHSGDCCPFSSLESDLKKHSADLALLPINGRSAERAADGILGNFTADEAVSLVKETGIPFAVGHHFGMFDFNTVDPIAVLKKIKENYPEMAGRFFLPEIKKAFALRRET